MLIPLSYPLSQTSPLYPGTPPVRFTELKSMSRGDSANQTTITLSSHAGTHIDAPSHFCPAGKTIRETFIYGERIGPSYCLDFVKGPGECITVSDIQERFKTCTDAVALLIRTGAYGYRTRDPDTYRNNHPWVHEDVPEYLRSQYPKLRLFGLDTLSLTHPEHREQGRECHRRFLCYKPEIAVLEDLDLSFCTLSGDAFSLYIFPWILDDLDGVPVCVFAER
jgi:kynurenine formamidase